MMESHGNGSSSDRDIWLRLSRGSRSALWKIAELLAAGHTGTVVLTTHKGGVRRVEITEAWTPSDREDDRGRPSPPSPIRSTLEKGKQREPDTASGGVDRM